MITSVAVRLGALVSPVALGAQTVTGLVTRHGALLNSAIVILADSVGHAVAQSAVGDGGRYLLRSPREGTFRVRVLQIGWQPWSSDRVVLRANQPVTRNLAVSSIRVALDAVHVVERSECALGTDSSAAAFGVWEEARKALLAASLTTAEPLSITVAMSERTFDASGDRLLADSSSTRSGRSVKPFVTPSPDSLSRSGYLTADRATTTYWAPDADVLLSDPFLAAHCLSLTAPSDPNLVNQRIGVAFRPTTARAGIVDITGVLWLDRASAELRSLEFAYVNASALALSAHSGGRTDFLRLPNGRWITARWSIRYPVIESFTADRGPVVPGVARAQRPAARIVSVKTTSGEILSVRRDADTVWTRGKVSPFIRVIDSATARPLSRVLVGVASSGRASATDSLGAVRLERVVPGPLTLRLASPKVSRAADEPRLIAVNVPDINDAEIVVSIPSADAIALRQCGDDMRRWGEGMVRIPSSARAAAPLTSVAALVRTPFIRLGAKDTVWVERQLPFTRDSAGAFYLCGVSRDATIQLAGTLPADALPSHFAVGEIVLYLSAPARP